MSEVSSFMEYGISALALGMLFWIVKALMGALDKTSGVIAANTTAIDKLSERMSDDSERLERIEANLNRRPCMMRDE